MTEGPFCTARQELEEETFWEFCDMLIVINQLMSFISGIIFKECWAFKHSVLLRDRFLTFTIETSMLQI